MAGTGGQRYSRALNPNLEGVYGNPDSNAAPANASDAPKTSTVTIGSGLVAALNLYQQQLKQKKLIEREDVYEIKFADNIIAGASIVPPAGLDKALAVGGGGGTAADQKLPNKQSMDPTVRARAATVGQQIVQFIDQVIRSSNYIQNQAIQVYNQTTKEWDKRPTNANQFAWFQVVCNVEQLLPYDNKRNDFAYKMTFTIVPYETPMLSTFFPSGQYRGVHKDYQYWFTGQNNSVLSFEQSYNAQWVQAITGNLPPDNRVLKVNDQTSFGASDYALRWKTNVFPASSQSNQGGENNTMEPGANAADFLYTADLATAKIVIVGDPAWLPSPASQIVTKDSFTVNPFLTDGTVNSIASGAYFRIRFNTPADYNLQTGLIDPSDQSSTTLNARGVNTVETIYKLQHLTSTFKGGKFTQELTGSWVTYDAAAEQVARAKKKKATPQARPSNQETETPFVTNGGGAAFGNPNITAQGQRAGATQTNPTAAPLSPDVKNAPAPPASGQVVTGTLDRINKQASPNSNPGQVMNREP